MDWSEPNAYFFETSLQIVSPLVLGESEKTSPQSSDSSNGLAGEQLFEATTFEHPWQGLSNLAADLAKLLCLLAQASIPWELVEPMAAALDWEETQVDEARLELLEADFLQLTDVGDYRMEPSVHEFVRMQLTDAAQTELLKRTIAQSLAIVASVIAEATPRRHADTLEATIPHLAEAAISLTAYCDREWAGWHFIAIGSFYTDRADYREAEFWYIQCLSSIQAHFGQDHQAVLTSLNNLGYLHEQQGQFDAAEPLYVQAVEIGQRLLGDTHLLVATSLNNLASLYKFQGRYSEAELLYLQALEIREQNLGEQHPSVATSINNLAGLYYAQERFDSAELLFLKALRLRRGLLGEAHPSVAISLNNLASVFYRLGRHSQAIAASLEAVRLSEQILGANHPETLAFKRSLQMIQANLRSQAAAPSRVQSVLSNMRRLLGQGSELRTTQD